MTPFFLEVVDNGTVMYQNDFLEIKIMFEICTHTKIQRS